VCPSWIASPSAARLAYMAHTKLLQRKQAKFARLDRSRFCLLKQAADNLDFKLTMRKRAGYQPKKDGGLIPRHPLPHNRTALVMRRAGGLSAPNVSCVGSHPHSLPAPRTQTRGKYAPNSLSSVAQRCRALASDVVCASPAGRRTPLSTASRWRFFVPTPVP
jgi:hypothetical protein